MHKPLYYLSLALFIFTSCATNNQLITVERPPDLILSNDIVRIALVDRSKPSNATLTVVEGVFTGEYIGADRQGRKEVLRSFGGVMDLQDRFEIVSTDVEWEGTKSGATLPKPLPVDKIKTLAEEHEVDAVLALESFDSDGHSVATDYLALGAWYLGVFDPVDYPSNIRTGWRLYDAVDGAILDEFQTFTAADGWWTDASVMPYDQLDIISEGSRIAAYQYAGRIVPMPVQYDRMYYRKAPGANDKMKAADRLVRAERWEKAEALWKQVYDRAENNKAKARSAYNMAIIAERNGDLDGALKWLDEAITYGNDPAIAYAALITERKEFQMWHELNQFKEKEAEEEINVWNTLSNIYQHTVSRPPFGNPFFGPRFRADQLQSID